MAFINEYASQDDINRFKLDELLNKYLNTTASYKHHWIVDKDTESWLLSVKQINRSESLWILHYKNTNIEVELFKTKQGDYDLISIAPNSLNNVEIISTLREALKVLGPNDFIHSIPKETNSQEKKETKTNIKQVSKRKLTYLNVLTAIIVFAILFFIANESSNGISSIVKNDDNNKTSTKAKTIKSKYNLCAVSGKRVYLANSNDLKTMVKTVEILNNPKSAQLEGCDVDKYGNLYWTDRQNDGLYKANLDGTNIRKILTIPEGASDLAIDNIGERIFTAQWNKKRKHQEIVYSNLSGNNKTILISNRELLRNVTGIFYDYVYDKLYVSDLAHKQIVVIDLKTKELKKIIDSNRPEGIVIDYKNEKIIWVDNDVYSANLDGSDKKVIIPSYGEDRGSGILTIDTMNNRLIYGYNLYNIDSYNSQNNKYYIETSNLDGTQRTKIKSRMPLDEFSFFNNNFIESQKAEINPHEIVNNQNKIAISPELKKCSNCHGKDWSKSALGKSAIVKNMSKENIAIALKGYKDGTYGGLMKGQISKYSDRELEAMAEAIKSQ